MAKKTNSADINDQIIYGLKVSERSKVPFLFMSAPGMGKTTTVEKFAEMRGYKMVQLRGNSTSEQEVMGYDVVDQTPGSRSTIRTRPGWYCELLEASKEGKKTLLFLDEITTCPEHVQSALLHLIFERRVGTEDIPEDTLIVSAGNYAQCLSNAFSLIPPLMNRFCIYNIVPDPDDVDIFLSKYSGSLSGKGKEDIWAAKKKKLDAADSREKLTEDFDMAKVGEYIEKGILETVKMLMKSGERPVDLKVTDMQSIYSDTENDSTLKGFVTMRTLNYLRDVTLAAFQCYGKEGIQSSNYRKMVEGLTGIGLSRNSKTGDVKQTDITQDFYNAMITVVADIEKMKNKRLPEYAKFFEEHISGKEKTELKPEEVNILKNKVQELKSDLELKSVDRPLDPELIDKLCTAIVTNSRASASIRLTVSEKLSGKISPEDLAGYVVKWNSLADLLETIGTLVSDPQRNYKDPSKTTVQKTIDEMKKDSFKLSSLKKIMSKEVPAAESIIPDLHTSYVK
jgi:MoxR-like ATPase